MIFSNKGLKGRVFLRKYRRDRLRNLLELAEDEDFFHLLWAAHLLQSDDPSVAKKLLQTTSYHSDAVGPNIPLVHRVHPWELETLANLALSTPKKFVRKGIERKLRFDQFNIIAECVDRLRKLENAEYAHEGHQMDVLMELSRVAHRQFPWQAGYVNTANLYRNIFVYGQGKCAEYFEASFGISIVRFSFVSLALFASLKQFAIVAEEKIFARFGISKCELESTLALVAIPHSRARTKAKEMQQNVNHVACMPSILRQAPCLAFETQGRRIRSPLPELIIDRISSGLFYDIIKYSGSGDDFGPRFEKYCLELLSSVFPKINWIPEQRYGPRKSKRSTPDILGKCGNHLQFVFECKARRMSHQAMFGRGPTQDDGVKDLGKGIRQIWTFYAHTREGLTSHTLSPNVFGAILAMDNWGTMGQAYIKKFFDEAERQIAEVGLDVQPADRRRVQIIPILSLERVMAKATHESFLEACDLARADEYDGWLFEDVHRKAKHFNTARDGNYPFTSRLGDLLPWWKEFQ